MSLDGVVMQSLTALRTMAFVGRLADHATARRSAQAGLLKSLAKEYVYACYHGALPTLPPCLTRCAMLCCLLVRPEDRSNAEVANLKQVQLRHAVHTHWSSLTHVCVHPWPARL